MNIDEGDIHKNMTPKRGHVFEKANMKPKTLIEFQRSVAFF